MRSRDIVRATDNVLTPSDPSPESLKNCSVASEVKSGFQELDPVDRFDRTTELCFRTGLKARIDTGRRRRRRRKKARDPVVRDEQT